MELLKLNDKGEEVTCISNEEAENISGGLEIVGEPVYKLNGLEMVWLKDYGYTIESVGDEKFKIKDQDGKVANPQEIQRICSGREKKLKEEVPPLAIMRHRWWR